jgi:hypothetical protein
LARHVLASAAIPAYRIRQPILTITSTDARHLLVLMLRLM